MDMIDHIDPGLFDVSTPPGEDFYRHVNGGWLDSHPVPSEYPAWGAAFEVHVRNEGILHELLVESAEDPSPPGSAPRLVGDYFASGMDEQAIAALGASPLDALLGAIGRIDDVESLTTVLRSLREVGVGAFHSLGISPDFEDANRYLVYVGQGGLGLPERDYYLRDDERSVSLLAAYVEHVSNQLENLGVGGREQAEAILELEKRLAEASLPSEEIRKAEVRYNRHRTADLDQLMPQFGLRAYLRDLGVTSDTVNLDNAGFFSELDGAIAETPLPTIRAYLAWHLVRTFAPALSPVFEDEAFDFYNRKLGGQQQPRDRWMRVLGAASSDIGELVARLYVEAAFSPEAKDRCEHLVDGLIGAMERSIRSLDWMTDETREAALRKLAGFSYKIGYPDVWKDYSGLVIERASYVGNRMNCAVFEFDREMARLEEPVDRGEWAMPAHIVNAYYHPMLNEIVFPAGILQPPFFYPDGDDAVNYGGIGTVIGHEITHGFDDNGSQFDEHGRRRNWWTDEDRTEFEERAETLVSQFSQFAVNDDQHVNGRLTLGENIADLGGLKIAYDAFVSTLDGSEPDIGGLSPRERFFLSYGTIWRMNYTEEYLRMLVNVDVHSPNPFRVNGPLSNFPPFAEVFAIEPGSAMRRSKEQLAEIW
jgi:predicted metalloendopeptidase